MIKSIKNFAYIVLALTYFTVSSDAQAESNFKKPLKLTVSEMAPSPGDTVEITLDVEGDSKLFGKTAWFVLGLRPEADGLLVNPAVLGKGTIDNDGKAILVQPIPEDIQLGTQLYVQAFVDTSAKQKSNKRREERKKRPRTSKNTTPFNIGDGSKLPSNAYTPSFEKSIIVGTMMTPKLDNPDFIVTPNSYIDVAKDQEFMSSNPITAAYNKAVIGAKNGGALIVLKDGLYKEMVLKATCHDPSLKLENMIFIKAENPYKAVIDRKSYGGSFSVTIEKICNTTIIGLKVYASQYWGIRLGMKNGAIIKNISFLKTEIDGGFDHYAQTGYNSRWGVAGYNMDNILFRDFYIHDLWQEHAFYLHNISGDVTIENGTAERTGRTAYQQVARTIEGTAQTGLTSLRNFLSIDAGIGISDAYKGGSAFTFAGGYEDGEGNNILLDNLSYRAGFDDELNATINAATNGKMKKAGTGALSVWEEKNGNGTTKVYGPNAPILLQNSTFIYADGAGDRQNLNVSGARSFTIKNISANNALPSSTMSYPVLDLNKDGDMDTSDFHLSNELTNEDIIGTTKLDGNLYAGYTELLQAMD
jgi:hypothetical protein